ncbi:MAG: hypothetical protein A3D52_00495 [Candidatus Taylorbacteria bacterium RIFCSPHIGHO2_02_FULL_44_36]|uniref:Lipid-A-disaccharide synthase n=1 Tax=Candidatus Taylorbacteria bacterium RIFCSPLOWO2_12_FULL_44_15c TaxID=1802333 RepID=A0A1G2P479_9BACT|nr:MAG: hypothetical protein A3D52_00495 [Candidatus Taylorbacteria bacterium RIFCSPHIGHO2_02_FULL_44_36]OHA43167.1 MAG: hypothetical protein A3G03_01715 [Candidatus Taylorbacteria bacterium RIFCSPLOWO2_12_FULL_44_15c]
MKTIFISSFHGVVARNILMTPVLKTLQEQTRVVILSPAFKKEYFSKVFASPKIEIMGIGHKLTRVDLFFRSWALAASKTRGLYIKHRSKFFQDGNLFSFLAAVLPPRFGAASRFGFWLLRLGNRLFFGKRNGVFSDLFDKEQPALVFATDIQNELDVRLLEEAKRRDIKTIGMIRSWDNLSTKGAIRVQPDILIVNNEIIKKEAVNWNFIEENKIKVVGIPHHDRYQQTPPILRAEFLKNFGFENPNRRLILFAPIGNRYIRRNTLDQKVLENLSQFDANVLVRLPPGDRVDLKEIKNSKAQIVFDKTGVNFEGEDTKSNEIGEQDDRGLWYSVYFTDVIVTGQSTVALDAALCDKGSVIINFDAEPRPYWDSIRRYYDYEYYQNIVKTSGVTMAKSLPDLISSVKKYLADSSYNAAPRRQMILGQEYKIDGRSSERLAVVLLEALVNL